MKIYLCYVVASEIYFAFREPASTD